MNNRLKLRELLTLALFGHFRPKYSNKSWSKCWFHIAPNLCGLPECFGPTFVFLGWEKKPHFKVRFCSSKPKHILASTVFGRRATPTFFGFFTLSLNHRKPLAWEWPWDSFFEIMAGDGCSLNLLCKQHVFLRLRHMIKVSACFTP